MPNERLAIIAGARTPQAKAFGKLTDVNAVQLGVAALEATLQRAKVAAEQIDEVIFGNVAGPPDAANIARVIALTAGIPFDRIAHTVNRNCASGMEAIVSAWLAIDSGRANLCIAGGSESMSQIPLLVRESTKRKLMSLRRAKSLTARLKTLLSLRTDDLRPLAGVELGLTDPTCGMNMGQTAELLAEEFSISREEQDEFAVASHRKAIEASKKCFLSGEIIPVRNPDDLLKMDVGPREGQSMNQLAKLRPIFSDKGTVTAGNSCPLTDGATALLLAAESYASRITHEPLGFVSDYAIAGCDPRRMGLGPVFATAKLLQQTGLELNDFDLIEINEAFAAQVLACIQAMGSTSFARDYLHRDTPVGTVDLDKLNVHGGAIALGHPVGASGARLVLTMARALRDRGLHRGLVTLCVGGGQGFAMMIEA